ncbi:hypothetical protein CRG98_033296 [Punica granatum]|uniref:Retrotransposon gag domain-containing protein n=1 Tax=Punica granatum TaxID=22663 RepID=A0A2I0IRL5_PUNGR|nr:hypothetical protein CRG98_033296 [Punica granatum]
MTINNLPSIIKPRATKVRLASNWQTTPILYHCTTKVRFSPDHPYEGKSDLNGHISRHVTSLLGRTSNDRVKCLLFPRTLTRLAADWFYSLPAGRPTLNAIKVVALTFHLKLKFPTSNRVGEICED